MSTSIEWCVWWGGDDPNDCAGRLQYDDVAEAREMAQWITGGRVAGRVVARRPWSCPDNATGDGRVTRSAS